MPDELTSIAEELQLKKGIIKLFNITKTSNMLNTLLKIGQWQSQGKTGSLREFQKVLGEMHGNSFQILEF